MAVFKIGVFFDLVVCLLDIVIGVTLGLILVGAGVNPATAVTLCTFKIVQQAVSAANLIFLIAAGLLLDDNLPIAEVIQKYFYSDNMPPIGTQISFMLLMINQYGHYLSQGTLLISFTRSLRSLLNYTFVVFLFFNLYEIRYSVLTKSFF
jgi:hypothetical protein